MAYSFLFGVHGGKSGCCSENSRTDDDRAGTCDGLRNWRSAAAPARGHKTASLRTDGIPRAAFRARTPTCRRTPNTQTFCADGDKTRSHHTVGTGSGGGRGGIARFCGFRCCIRSMTACCGRVDRSIRRRSHLMTIGACHVYRKIPHRSGGRPSDGYRDRTSVECAVSCSRRGCTMPSCDRVGKVGPKNAGSPVWRPTACRNAGC